MSNDKSALEQRYTQIKEHFKEQINFMVADLAELFPELEKASLYWTISKLVNEGYLKRVRNGVYSLNENKGKQAVLLSEVSKRISDILDLEGYEYYISGVDVISKFMHHIPEEYPTILFVEKNSETDVIQTLKDAQMSVIKANAVKDLEEDYVYTIIRPDVIIYATDNFEYAKNNIAINEKAFIDLFFAITRNYYPMPLQELARVYENMVRLGTIDQKKMITISYKRNLQHDIRYIVESKYLSDGAKEFVKYIS